MAPAEMRLHSYGWIDQEAGTVHIPIERAMELVVSEGLPARATDVPNFDLPPAYRLDSNGGQEVESP
ncbi:MAG: hypothetical protein R2867_11425 [Caldilineaceae bacterium]